MKNDRMSLMGRIWLLGCGLTLAPCATGSAEFTQWVEDAFPFYEVVLDTLQGPVICTLVEVEKDNPELKDCRTEDNRLLTVEEIEALGLDS